MVTVRGLDAVLNFVQLSHVTVQAETGYRVAIEIVMGRVHVMEAFLSFLLFSCVYCQVSIDPGHGASCKSGLCFQIGN